MPSFLAGSMLKNSVTQAYILFFLIFSSPVLQIFAIQSQDKEASMKVQLLEELWK